MRASEDIDICLFERKVALCRCLISSCQPTTHLLLIGLICTRCLGPFLVETCALVEEGVGLEQLDKVMKSYGLPVGPITLADEVRIKSYKAISRCS